MTLIRALARLSPTRLLYDRVAPAKLHSLIEDSAVVRFLPIILEAVSFTMPWELYGNFVAKLAFFKEVIELIPLFCRSSKVKIFLLFLEDNAAAV